MTEQIKAQKKVVRETILISFIKTCRQYADVLNMSYINHKCGENVRWMSDIVGRKKPIRDAEKVLKVLDSLLEYCDEVEQMREKIDKIRDEVHTQIQS